MNLIRFFVQHSGKITIWSLIAGILSGASGTALLAVINIAVRGKSATTSGLVASFVALCIFLPISRYTAELLLNRIGQQALFKLRVDLGRRILGVPLLRLEQLGVAPVMAALTDDIPTLAGVFLVVPTICVNAAAVIGCLVYMGYLSPQVLALVLVAIVVGIIGYQLPIMRTISMFKKAREQNEMLLGHFRAVTQGAKELKMHGMRRRVFLSDGLEKTAEAARFHNVAATKIYSAAASWGQCVVFLVVGLVVFVLPLVRRLEVGELTGYALALLYMMNPLQYIMNVLVPTITRANVALSNLNRIGVSLSEQEAVAGVMTSQQGNDWSTLEVRSVTHTYRRPDDNSRFVLGPIDLTFHAGETVFITGGNGSGKTTFIKVLVGLYAPEDGELRLDGKSIRSQDERERYRQYFSVVFYDFYLFEQLMGIVDSELDERASRYLNQLQLAHKVRIEEGRFSTMDLSQGERKRLALLTAYLEDRPIYLFDEWAADQDPSFKDVFYLQLLPELKARNKTVLVVSHDDRYYHVADRVIKLDAGQVVSDTRVSVDRMEWETVGR